MNKKSIIAGLTTLVPGFTFFVNYSPPLFEGISILISALGGIFLWKGFKEVETNSKEVILKKTITILLMAFVLIIMYLLLLDKTTILMENLKDSTRYQIGFGLEKWTLTDDAIKAIEKDPDCGLSNSQLLKCLGATKESVYRLWKPNNIYFFGVLNIFIFSAASLLWCYGMGKLMKTMD